MTLRQQSLKNSTTASRLVSEWGGTAAQLKCRATLNEVAGAGMIVTLSDVSRVYGNTVSLTLIAEHLKSILLFANATVTEQQMMETALSLQSAYWFLNVAELCVFFTRLKNGQYGQFVWGKQLNNQAILVALSDFCTERRNVIERKENEVLKSEQDKGYNTIKSFGMGIVRGLDEYHKMEHDARLDINAFIELFPLLPPQFTKEEWWKAYKDDCYYDCVPVGKYLCDYNAKNKT